MYMQQQTETLLTPKDHLTKERLQESVENLLKKKHQRQCEQLCLVRV